MKDFQKRIVEKVDEIRKDYDKWCSEKLAEENILTAIELCGNHNVLQFAYGFEASEHLVCLLQNGLHESGYDELDDIMILALEIPNVMYWVMEWCNTREYYPDITTGEAIGSWMIDCLEDYQKLNEGETS